MTIFMQKSFNDKMTQVVIDENVEFKWKCEYDTAENLLIAFPCSFWNCFYIPKYITAPA